MSSETINIDTKIVSVRLGEGDGEVTNDALPQDSEEIILDNVKLPDDAPARMKTLRAEGKKWYLTVVYHPNSEDPFALFCTTNHKEKTAQTSDAVERLLGLAREKGIPEEHIESLEKKIANENNVNKLTRSVSLLLRHGVMIKNIVGALDRMDDIFVGSFLFQIKKFLSQYIRDGERVEGVTCDECGGSNVIYSGGCNSCLDCGSSECS